MNSNIKKVIDELANVATTLEFELTQDPVSQPRTAALKRLMAVHRKELNSELTALQGKVPKLDRKAKGAPRKAKADQVTAEMVNADLTANRIELKQSTAKNSADQTPADFDDGKTHEGKQPSDVPTE